MNNEVVAIHGQSPLLQNMLLLNIFKNIFNCHVSNTRHKILDEMKAWLQAFGYKVEFLHPQLEVTKENIKYHHTSDI